MQVPAPLRLGILASWRLDPLDPPMRPDLPMDLIAFQPRIAEHAVQRHR